MALNQKQKRFAQEYVIDFNATKAAQRAGYSERTAYSQGQRLLKHVEIQQKIQENIQKIANSTQITAERVLNELAKLAFYNPKDFYNSDGSLKDISDLTDEQAACINGLEIVDIPKRVAKLKKIKIADKNAALDKLMRYLALYRDKVEHEHTGNIKHELSEPLAEAIKGVYAKDPQGSA